MRNLRAWALLALLLAVASLPGADGAGVLKKIDADKGIVVITVGNTDHTLQADKNLNVKDGKGKELPEGLKSSELKIGARVSVNYERSGGMLVLKELRLGQQGQGRAFTQNPERTSVGFKPLCDMTAEDRYKGEDGGLYGGGKNEPPAEHQAAARKETARISPLDAQGKPAKDGKIVLISIGYSNVTQMFRTFKSTADADAQKSPAVTIVDCAQSGQTMSAWARTDFKCWDVADQRLEDAGVTREQVQVVWMKMANIAPKGELNEHAKKLKDDTVTVLHNLKKRFPNLRIVYLGSRVYAGYATGTLNPEPYAYEGAFAVRWLLLDQIKKDPELNYDAARGPVKAPLILWGPYLWADGLTPRKSDGLTWESKDLAADGVHPSPSGSRKVTALLLNFLKTDANAKTWFVK
ncbi:MAG: hypothetical protein AB7K24_29580 [Gemmataceae bacterium]